MHSGQMTTDEACASNKVKVCAGKEGDEGLARKAMKAWQVLARRWTSLSSLAL